MFEMNESHFITFNAFKTKIFPLILGIEKWTVRFHVKWILPQSVRLLILTNNVHMPSNKYDNLSVRILGLGLFKENIRVELQI